VLNPGGGRLKSTHKRRDTRSRKEVGVREEPGKPCTCCVMWQHDLRVFVCSRFGGVHFSCRKSVRCNSCAVDSLGSRAKYIEAVGCRGQTGGSVICNGMPAACKPVQKVPEVREVPRDSHQIRALATLCANCSVHLANKCGYETTYQQFVFLTTLLLGLAGSSRLTRCTAVCARAR
jgi:hypothetical protein